MYPNRQEVWQAYRLSPNPSPRLFRCKSGNHFLKYQAQYAINELHPHCRTNENHLLILSVEKFLLIFLFTHFWIFSKGRKKKESSQRSLGIISENKIFKFGKDNLIILRVCWMLQIKSKVLPDLCRCHPNE